MPPLPEPNGATRNVPLSDRLRPHSPDAEQASLGAALISKTAADTLLELVKPEEFYFEAHRKIAVSMAEMARREEPLDSISLADDLRRKGLLDSVGGAAYVVRLWESVPTAAHVEFYARKVQECADLRALIEASEANIGEAYAQELSAGEIRDRAEARVLAVGARRERLRSSPAARFIPETVSELWGDGGASGVQTGFSTFDRLVNGLPTDLCLLAGRPSMGKTGWGLAVSVGAAKRGTPVQVYSMESRERSLGRRMLAAESGVRLGRLRPGVRRTDEEVRLLTKASDKLRKLPLHICDEPEMSAAMIRSHLRRAQREHGIGLCVIDQLQTIVRPERTENENVSLSRIAYDLQRTAGALGIPVLLQCQLNRDVERREEKRPLMSDLRDTGGLEQAAGLIVMLFRASYYSKDGREPDETEEEVIIRKQREGNTGVVKFHYNRATQRFAEMDTQHQEQDGWHGYGYSEQDDE